eukprot:SAG22_NODE_13131_length_417_cov_1.484277_1_plen_49_part_00
MVVVVAVVVMVVMVVTVRWVWSPPVSMFLIFDPWRTHTRPSAFQYQLI